MNKNFITIPNIDKYTITDEDMNFFYSDEARGVRLQVDYLKAEEKMKKEGIEHTIVVFGSASILDHDTSVTKINKIKEALKKSPDSQILLNDLKMAGNMLARCKYYDDARKFGQLVGKSGRGPKDCYVTIMTGGGPGIMEAANRGAHDVGAKSIGLNIELPHEQSPNPYITPGLSFQFYYFGMRKLHFMQRAKALVVFPGGFGTFDELFEILTLVQTKKKDPIPIILVEEAYWKNAINFYFLVEEGLIREDDLDIFMFAKNADEAWGKVLNWYEEFETPLF